MISAYLCGPITNGGTLSPEAIKVNIEMFNLVRLRISPNVIINDPTLLPRQSCWEDYMKLCIPMLCKSSYMVLLNGWSDSRGCILEVSIAHTLGIPIILAEHLLDRVQVEWTHQMAGFSPAETDTSSTGTFDQGGPSVDDKDA